MVHEKEEGNASGGDFDHVVKGLETVATSKGFERLMEWVQLAVDEDSGIPYYHQRYLFHGLEEI